jgi:hypothetical protein
MNLDLLTKATVVDDAIRFVSQKSKENIESTFSSNYDDKESNEPNYDEGSREINNTTITTNEIF